MCLTFGSYTKYVLIKKQHVIDLNVSNPPRGLDILVN